MEPSSGPAHGARGLPVRRPPCRRRGRVSTRAPGSWAALAPRCAAFALVLGVWGVVALTPIWGFFAPADLQLPPLDF